MANTKEIQKRMKSIQDTMKITNAMYMISSSKLRNAKKKLEDTEPYFFALEHSIARFLRNVTDVESKYFDLKKDIPTEKKKRGFIVITADKGMAGAYNHNVVKLAHELFKKGENNRLFVVGEVGRHTFAREGLSVDTEFKYTVQDPSLHRARVITERILDLYNANELDEVYIVYTRMVNSFSMNAEAIKLLPLDANDFLTEEADEALKEEEATGSEIVEAEPSFGELLDHVVPSYVTGDIYSTLVESFASEHNSRMMAMQNATDNAKDMLSHLNIEYNRVRQAAITQELTEVISGAKSQKRKKKK